MTKYEKENGEPKVADLKRIDPAPTTMNKHHKKKYPPHWQVRSFGLWQSKNLKGDNKWKYAPVGKYIYKHSEEYDQAQAFFRNNQLDECLAIYEKHHPETKDWPVRFINVPVMVTTREVIT